MDFPITDLKTAGATETRPGFAIDSRPKTHG
jgi:hypothetical protein